MTVQDEGLAGAAAALRAAFDGSFAELQAADAASYTDLLAIRVGEHPYALRLSEVLAVHTDRKLVPVPGPRPELLGLVGLRGLVVPVYDLRQLLGYAAGPPPRWLAVARNGSPIAVAFEAFEAHLRVADSEVITAEAGATALHSFARGSIRTSSGPRPLIHLPSLIGSVTRGTGRASDPVRDPVREERR